MRFYDPGIARFIARDMLAQAAGAPGPSPEGLMAGGARLPAGRLNLYGYVSNSPLVSVDPMGLEEEATISAGGTLQVWTLGSGWWDAVTFDFKGKVWCYCTTVEEPVPGTFKRRRAFRGTEYWAPEYEEKKVWLLAGGPGNISWSKQVTDKGVTKHWAGVQVAHHMAKMGWKLGGKEGHVDYIAIAEEFPEKGWLYGSIGGRVLGMAGGAAAGALLAKKASMGAKVGAFVGGLIGQGVGTVAGHLVENRYRGELHYKWEASCDESGKVTVRNVAANRTTRGATLDNDARWR